MEGAFTRPSPAFLTAGSTRLLSRRSSPRGSRPCRPSSCTQGSLQPAPAKKEQSALSGPAHRQARERAETQIGEGVQDSRDAAAGGGREREGERKETQRNGRRQRGENVARGGEGREQETRTLANSSMRHAHGRVSRAKKVVRGSLSPMHARAHQSAPPCATITPMTMSSATNGAAALRNGIEKGRWLAREWIEGLTRSAEQSVLACALTSQNDNVRSRDHVLRLAADLGHTTLDFLVVLPARPRQG
eukprot:3263632-Rhodomonas_salina.2